MRVLNKKTQSTSQHTRRHVRKESELIRRPAYAVTETWWHNNIQMHMCKNAKAVMRWWECENKAKPPEYHIYLCVSGSNWTWWWFYSTCRPLFLMHVCFVFSPFGDARHLCSVYLCVCMFACVAEMIPSIWLQGLQRYGVTLRIGSEHCCVWKYSKIGIGNFSNHNCTETPLGGPFNLCSHRHWCTEEFKTYCSSAWGQKGQYLLQARSQWDHLVLQRRWCSWEFSFHNCTGSNGSFHFFHS